MKFLKKRIEFLNEAKIKDLILPIQAKEVARKWGEEYLDYEEIDPTDNIKQGKWKLSEEDKNLVLGQFLGSNYESIKIEDIFNFFTSMPDKLITILKDSINPTDNESQIIFEEYDPKKPTLEQIYYSFYKGTFYKKLMVSETQKDEYIKRDESGKPLKDENNQIIKVKKEIGEPIYDNKNFVTIKTQIELYNAAYNEQINTSNRSIELALNILSNRENPDYVVDLRIFDKDIYLSINHNPHDILNMSISRFYSSCQHLYSGGYRDKLLANVFDPNSIPAFLIFESPIYKNGEKISEFLPLSRMMIRNVDTFSEKGEVLFFDRAYPDRMKGIFSTLIEKYSGNVEENDDSLTYVFSPDIDFDKQDSIAAPYMDRLSLKRKNIIGKNTKNIYLNRNYDWSNIKISPSARIENMIIETEKLPENISILDLNINTFKFKYLKLNTLEPFKKIKVKNNLSFDKCFISEVAIHDINNYQVMNLEFISCQLESFPKDLNVEKLTLLYTLDNINELEYIIKSNQNLKEVAISGELVTSKEDKSILNKIKSNFKQVKIKISGLVI
jgi:hypothetical protein